MRQLQIGLIYLVALLQGVAMVTFTASGNIFVDPLFHGITEQQYGFIFIPNILCSISASFFGGALAKRIGLKTLFLFGVLSNALCMGLLAATKNTFGDPAQSYTLLLASMMFMGCAFGSILTSLNTYAASFFPKKSEIAVTAAHATVGVGTAIAPLFLGIAINRDVWWLQPFFVSGLMAVLFVGGLILPLKTDTGSATEDSEGQQKKSKIPKRLLGFALIALLYGLCETIFGNWAVIYLFTVKNVAKDQAGVALSLFWTGLTAGRILATILSVWISSKRIYLTLPAMIIIGYAGTIFLEGAQLSLFAFGFSGLACSAFVPLAIGFATKEFSDNREFVSGLMMASFMVGFGLSSIGVGALLTVEGIGLQQIYFVGGLMSIVLFVLTTLHARTARPS